MLDNLTEPSEDSKTFYPSDEVEDSKEHPDTVEDDPSEDDQEVDDADESAEDAEEEEAETEDEPESMTVYGKEITREDFELMQNQQLMQADYTKKMQAVATERKQAETLSADLSAIITSFESDLVGENSEEELAELLEDGDTAEYLRRTKQIKDQKDKLKAAKAKISDALTETQASESKKLIEVMTEWADPKTGQETQKADMTAAVEYAASLGYDNAELNSLADHKIIKALIDAGKYHALKKSKPATSKVKTRANKKVSAKKAVEGKTSKSTSELFYGEQIEWQL